MKSKLLEVLHRQFLLIGGLIFLIAPFISFIGMFIGYTISLKEANESSNEVQKYHQYYEVTERLLDSLESEFNWSDRYGSDIVSEYYEKRRQLYDR